jgi:WD40 repeat protein
MMNNQTSEFNELDILEKNDIWSLNFSKENESIISFSTNKLFTYDLQNEKKIYTSVNYHSDILENTFLNSNINVLSTRNGLFCINDLREKNSNIKSKLDISIFNMKILSDGTTCLLSGFNDKFYKMDLRNLNNVLIKYENHKNSCNYDLDFLVNEKENVVLVGGDDGLIRFYDINKSDYFHSIGSYNLKNSIYSIEKINNCLFITSELNILKLNNFFF